MEKIDKEVEKIEAVYNHSETQNLVQVAYDQIGSKENMGRKCLWTKQLHFYQLMEQGGMATNIP